LIGRTLGKYRVLERLGAGGMGEVYAAEDTTLGRKVALKVLRPEVAGSAERRQRFQREARAVAALNHPNIVTLYSVEEADGELFITMELVEGRSLRELLRDGPLPVARAVALAAQVCEGLCVAHGSGVLHRDLKPDNLIVTAEDRVKILDFGLAKLLTPASGGDPDAATMSTPGMTMGTAGYMAPEQALGRALDARADLFAVGVVLYQMVTGHAPFEGETVAALFDHLLNRPPVPPQRHVAHLPAAIVSVIDRALEKDRDRRYPTARELLAALRRVEAAPTGAAPAAEAKAGSSIVVLPFVDLSREKDQEYFCHGVAEELIHSLARVPGLRVISRTSAFAFQDQGTEITEIGRRLKAATALEGSVRKSGNRVRISARLVNTEDGFQLWSKRFDRELEDVFAIEDEIAETIVSDLARELGGVSLRRPAPRNTGAHDAYLRGIYGLNKWTVEWMDRALASFQDAIALDPGFAPAYAALAEGHLWLYSGVGIRPAREAVPAARAAVERALELDPHLAEAHRVRGMIAMNHDWDRRGAEDGMLRAIEHSPGSAEARLWNAWRLALLEARYEEALVELGRAERLGPLDLQVKTQIGYVHYFLHDLDRAVAQFERALALDASFAFAHYALGDALTQQGDYARAIDEYTRSIELGGRSVNHIGVLGYVQGRAGNREAARALLDELAARAADSHVSPMWMALVHLGLDDRDRVFEWLEQAFEQRDGSLVLVTSAIEFDPVRDDPRFQELLKRMGLAHLLRPRPES
jgi:serine/threonine protein kinase/tetratricopeptide (TPR) repeat protein